MVLKPHVMGRIVASTMFLLVIAAVLLGLGYIVAHGLGYAMTFNGILPVFTPK